MNVRAYGSVGRWYRCCRRPARSTFGVAHSRQIEPPRNVVQLDVRSATIRAHDFQLQIIVLYGQQFALQFQPLENRSEIY